ncbi:MAG: META domain-containing protein [Steroidobacteraceae bacterium]
MLKSVDGNQTYAAMVGCNQMSGGLTLGGESIGFSPGVATLMACPPPLDAPEKSLMTALATTKRWHINGNTLELLGANNRQTALYEAVHL